MIRAKMQKWVRFLSTVTVATFLWYSPLDAVPSDIGDSPGVPSNPMEAFAKPAIGNINGIKLSIPHYYLSSGVKYEGEEPLSAFRSFTPNYDSKIENFGIVLRLSNLRPIRTEEDKNDYVHSLHTSKPFLYETWTTIDFSPKSYWHKGNLKSTITFWEKDELQWGPFLKQKERIAGLIHEDSEQSISDDTRNRGHYEFYYDDSKFNTFIYCVTRRKYKPLDGKFVLTNEISSRICTHRFVIPELKVGAEAVYSKEALPRWREIEAESRNIIHSFIIQ